MEQLGKYLKVPEPVKKGPRTEREYFIEEARAKINAGRVNTKYMPISYVALMLKVKHLSDFDLKWHYLECSKSDNFSSCFFGKLKIKK